LIWVQLLHAELLKERGHADQHDIGKQECKTGKWKRHFYPPHRQAGSGLEGFVLVYRNHAAVKIPLFFPLGTDNER
jgi:hypothetical protein